MLYANIGIHVMHFVEFARFEQENGIKVLSLEIPPFLDGMGRGCAHVALPFRVIDT